MSEESKQLVEKALTDLLAWARDAGEFAQEQAPQIAHEIVVWGAVEHGIYVLFGLASLAVAATVAVWLGKNFDRWDREDNILTIIRSGVVVFVGAVIGCCAFFDNLSPFLKAILAPRLYLLEYLRQLV